MRCLRTLMVLLLACCSVWPTVVTAQEVAARNAVAVLHDSSGRTLATAALSESQGQVLINLTFADPSALTGVHGLQIHEAGLCDPPDFATARGIFNPFAKEHGLRNPAGPMAGDIPSLVIGPNGLAGYNTSAPLATISPGQASLLRAGGTSLVLFAQADDGQTQPEGNAGARIACGVIAPTSPAAAAVINISGQQPADAPGPDALSALLIALLGALMIGAGVALRRSIPR